MTDSRLVSVIIAVRDGARFLAEAVDSARAQTHERVELIVVNDGSTDDSAALAETLAVDRLVALGTNRGVSTARNVGIAVATGDLVTFLDADDRMLPEKVARQLAYLDSHPDCSCVLTGQRIEVEPGVELPPWLKGHPGGVASPPPLAISGLIRTGAIYACGGFDPSLQTSEDMDLLFRLRRGGRGVAIIDDALVDRRIHGANATYATDQMERDLLRAVRLQTARPPKVSVVLTTGHPVPGAIGAGAMAEPLQVIVVEEGPTLGQAAARNHGVLLARGELVAFANGDPDWPRLLSARVAALDGDAGLDGICGPGLAVPVVRRRAFGRVGPFVGGADADEWREWYGRGVGAGLRFGRPTTP